MRTLLAKHYECLPAGWPQEIRKNDRPGLQKPLSSTHMAKQEGQHLVPLKNPDIVAGALLDSCPWIPKLKELQFSGL